MSTWPRAELDPIRRARVLAAALGGGCAEGVVDAPFAATWAWLTDFERSVPAFDAQVHRLRVLRRQATADHEQLRLRSSFYALPTWFDVRLEEGFCLMRGVGRLYVVVMAAVPNGPARTRVAMAEAIPLPGGRRARSFLQRFVEHDLQGIQRLVPGGPPS